MWTHMRDKDTYERWGHVQQLLTPKSDSPMTTQLGTKCLNFLHVIPDLYGMKMISF